MDDILVGISVKLTNPSGPDIDLLVHSYYLGRPSPCYVIENGVQRVIGGPIDSLEEMLDSEIAKHPGYSVTQRANLVAREPDSQKKKTDSLSAA